MSAHGSPERRPATPQHHLKSFFNAASCTSSSGIQITPPSASRTNLLSITRPFGEESSGYSDVPESSRLGRTRTSETLMRYSEDTEGSSDDEKSPQGQTSRRRSRIQAGLKKSSSFGSLFSPSKLHNLSRQRSRPEESSFARDETVGDSETTRRSESPKKGLGRSGSLKERAFELISKSKRSSFSESAGSSKYRHLTDDETRAFSPDCVRHLVAKFSCLASKSPDQAVYDPDCRTSVRASSHFYHTSGHASPAQCDPSRPQCQ